MRPAMETWEYTCNQSPSAAYQTVRFYVRTRVLELGGGAALNGEGIDLDFLGLNGIARIRFAKNKLGSHVSVTVPELLREKTYALLAGLVSKRKLKPFEKAGEIPIEKKPFTRAVDILKQHLAKPDFAQTIEVLPACQLVRLSHPLSLQAS